MTEEGQAGQGRPEPTLSERIRAQFGPDVDPGVTLEPRDADATHADFASEVLSRLSSRPGTSGRYHIQGELARGGQGAILRVWDEELRRHLAMKVTLGKVSQPDTHGPTPPVDSRTVGRFLEEAQVTGQLDHPGIVPVHELGLDNQGRVFFTMKLVKGEDLRAVFARVHAGEPGWTITRALSMLLKVCEAMSYAHAKRVIHRDLKPGNVMVGSYGEVYVMDWGLARVLDRKDDKDVRVAPQAASLEGDVHSELRERAASEPDSPLLTRDGDVLGTPAYMSPEQAAGQLERMGPPSDVYALGAMLYHLLTGHAPYRTPGARVNNFAILRRVQEGPPASVFRLAPDAPAELVAICEKAMAREPTARYADMSALAEDLRAFLERRVVEAYETGAVAELRKWIVRNRPLAGALAAGVLLLAGGLTTSLVFERRARQKTNDVLALSAIQELKELVERADALWPVVPARLPDYERWLADARVLVEGSADHPGLRDHEAKLAEIRRRARPATPEEAERDRLTSPRFADLEHARTKLIWMHRMLGDEPWPSEAEVEATLAPETLPADADDLNVMAWPLVDPDPASVVYGKEVRALVLARRAVAAARDDQRARVLDTLAWSLFRCGKPEEAVAQEQRAVDEGQDPLKAEFAASSKQLQEQVALWAEGEPRARRADEAAQLSARIAALEREVSERRTFEFEDAQDRWWHAQLSALVADLTAFADEKTGLDSGGTSKRHGWGVAKRADFARTIEARSVGGAEAKRRWSEAIDAISASPQYGGLVITAQLGLLPIGADPESGLWEFWHLQSGDEPPRGPDGRLVLSESMGVVLVLIPGGAFWMGAQKDDPTGINYDPQAERGEGPVHLVSLKPYFLSKYEMTQGQWNRFTGGAPSQFGPGHPAIQDSRPLLHPVEQVSWDDAMEVLARLGLMLPTEAQWERGARAGTDTPWSSGRERETLRGAANLADQAAARAGASWKDINDWPDLDDGWAVHATVGSLRPNAFGLHDVHGNLWEWCRDGFEFGFYVRSPKENPFRDPAGTETCCFRGGSFSLAASVARSAYRSQTAPTDSDLNLGLRPAKDIAP